MSMNSKTWAKTHSKTDYEPPFYQAADRSTWDWKKIYDVGTMGDHEGSQKLYYSTTGFGYAFERSELQGGYFEDAQELDATTLTVVKYMLGTIISDEHERDSRHIKGILGKIGKDMGASHRATRDAYVARVFNNAFSTAVWDDSALCDSHTTYSGDTVDNDLTPASFSYDNYWDMVKYFLYSMRTQKGLRQTDEPFALVYYPALQDVVEKVFKSPGEPDTGDRNANTLSGRQPLLIPCPELSSTTPYFLLGKGFKEHLVFDERDPVSVAWDDDFIRDGKACKTKCRFLTGVTDYMAIVGNPGA